MVRIGINGFGRIGRQVLKAVLERHPDQLQVVAINDLFDSETNAHLFKFDTNYGRWPGEVEAKEKAIVIDGQEVACFALRDPAQIPWDELGVDLVVEGTGLFRTGPQAEAHLEAGAKRVIITAPGKEIDLTVVMGVNDEEYDPQKHYIVSNASCTTNCLAPPAKVLHQAFGIIKGLMTTVHSYTNDQRILDLPHKDLRRARAAALNMIPTSTGAARALGLVIPELAGRFDGCSVRVPTPTVSLVDFTAVLAKPTDTDGLRQALGEAAEGPLKGIMAVDHGHLVSMDLKGDPHSSVVDMEFTQVLDGDLAKVLAWYDNEWGYSCRVSDLAAYMASKGV
ncbi:type I glyceraldehyde-3-phosphate dehydrogenase [Desulfoferula mesophila]|uniref:Glyceraldehyde-3-phosphate dehydrogenase n=1 Tax=Desulfoferula mesophila TaxID=3058419 RepID=A0AAU9EFX8_9BACT|nr:glyceraldehyde-3-phosphate dehydrogenase [Desulfoferula mesophilus]